MDTKQSKLMSPSLSPVFSSSLSTQAPTSIKDSLPSYGISIADAEKWNREYNTEIVPRIREDKFWGLLIEAAGAPDTESEVRSVMEQRNVQSRQNFDEQAYKLMLSGPKLFQDQCLKSVFLSALDEQHTVHGYRTFITKCLPVLVDALQQRKPNRRRSSNGTHRKPVSVSKTPASSGRTGIRRSLRSKKPITPPSESNHSNADQSVTKSTIRPLSPSAPKTKPPNRKPSKAPGAIRGVSGGPA